MKLDTRFLKVDGPLKSVELVDGQLVLTINSKYGDAKLSTTTPAEVALIRAQLGRTQGDTLQG